MRFRKTSTSMPSALTASPIDNRVSDVLSETRDRSFTDVTFLLPEGLLRLVTRPVSRLTPPTDYARVVGPVLGRSKLAWLTTSYPNLPGRAVTARYNPLLCPNPITEPRLRRRSRWSLLQPSGGLT